MKLVPTLQAGLFALMITLCMPAQAQGPGGWPGGRGGPGGRNWADLPQIGSLSGQVIDSINGENLEFATIALHLMRGDSLVGGGITNQKGRFKLSELRPGMYRVRIDFLGYEARTINQVAIRPDNPNVDLGQISLAVAGEVLEAVQVTAERPYMQVGIDRKVYTVSKDISTEGADAMTALANIPSVEVDVEGGVSLRGSSAVTVLIDGKPSGLTGTDQTAILEQLPASSIEAIEVITNPSAKFDPDGTAGIINVVLKKNRKKGLSGGITVGAGTNNKYNASTNINYRTKDVNLYANYGYRFEDNLSWRETSSENFLVDSAAIIRQDYEGESNRESHTGKIGMDWYLNPKTTLSASGLLNVRDRSGFGTTRYDILNSDESVEDLWFQDETDLDDGWNADIDLGLTREFSSRNHKLAASGRYSLGTSSDQEDVVNRLFFPDGTPEAGQPFERSTITETDRSVATVQVDYTHPKVIKGSDGREREVWRFETGIKGIFRDSESDYASSVLDTLEQAFLLDTAVSNLFSLSESILSWYSTFQYAWENGWGVQGGLRIEQALTDPVLVTTNEVFDNDYFSFFPSVYFAKELKNNQELQLNYSRRINRPGRWSLNPFVDVSDPLNIRIGNPDLNPEYVNSAEFNYVKTFKGGHVLTSSLFARHTTNSITSIRSLDSLGVTTSTWTNLGTEQDFGLELIGVVSPWSWWRMTLSGNLYYNQAQGTDPDGRELSNSAFGYTARMNSTFRIPKDFTAQANLFYRGPGVGIQGTRNAFGSLDLSVRKDFLDKKAALTLRVSDVFNTRRFRFTVDEETFLQNREFQRESRIGWLTFSYKFGKQQFDRRRRGNFNGGGGGDFGGDGMDF